MLLKVSFKPDDLERIENFINHDGFRGICGLVDCPSVSCDDCPFGKDDRVDKINSLLKQARGLIAECVNKE